ncbi:MAG: 4-alpha-glucanotransferase [Oscillospiraceae bacterium]|nr:4-alpha-glucanotransferase [Oscillospiraceae bacterium]
MIKRSSGVLMPMTSLPSPYGVGTMGKEAFSFVDFLADAGQKYWQLLPLGPTSYGDSPYQSFSSFAGNPYLIDLDLLAEEGLLSTEEIQSRDWGDNPARVDYGKLYEGRFPLLRLAFERGREPLREAFEAFCRENDSWLSNYALFMAVKGFFGMRSWQEWPDREIRNHRPDAVRRYTEQLREEIDFYRFVQFLFFRQWKALKQYAKEKGILFIGDIPIYVAMDSADIWAEPQFFQLNADGYPQEVSGVPPDDFNDDGQLWGNPLYNWDRMKEDGFGWWIRRIEGIVKLYDVIRIDHFRGLESYWAVPFGEKTAKNGRWRTGPGMALVGVLTSWFNETEFIAEDLGYTTAAVDKLLKDSGLPRMKVLEFGFYSDSEADHIPHRCQENSTCYIGTHDNEPVHGWLKTLSRKDHSYASRYMHITSGEGWCWGMIRTGMATASRLFVAQMQDLLELGGDARMNTPGTDSGHWQWRMLPGAADSELAAKLRGYTETYCRMEKRKPQAEEPEASEE